VFEIHGRAQTIDLRANEISAQNPLKQPEVVFAGCVAGGGGAAVVGGDEFKGLRLGDAHAARDYPQTIGAMLEIDNGANKVALFAPHLEQAAAVLLADGETSEAHVEEYAPIL
jgi:hypothetical protein